MIQPLTLRGWDPARDFNRRGGTATLQFTSPTARIRH
jgi:hypothetical protein